MDFTLMRFLDRFAFKNPKIFRPNDVDHAVARPKYQPSGAKKLAPSSAEYANKKAHEIPTDERFLHRFASIRAAQKQKAAEETGSRLCAEKRRCTTSLPFAGQGENVERDQEKDEVSSVDSDDFDRIMERFEPGEANEDFEWDEVDFAQEFGDELDPKLAKARRRRKRRSEAAAHKADDADESGGEILDEDASSGGGGSGESSDEDESGDESADESGEGAGDESSDEDEEFKRKVGDE